MSIVVREYDAKTDSKNRIRLQNPVFENFHVREMSDGIIVLSPVELTTQFQMSANTVSMMDESIKNIKEGKVSETMDLSDFKEREEKVNVSSSGETIK